MSAQTPNTSTSVRQTWLRRYGPSNPLGRGHWHGLALTALGNAAARETLVTATRHMAAIWTSLFEDLLVSGPEFRWGEDGPGIGRDGRIAYSSLLGRYVARAYLTRSEGVQVLVPVDVAKRRLDGTACSIRKDPPGTRGLEADWVGVDKGGRLVIAEAKGTFDKGIRTWQGPSSPRILRTAMDQARRTSVYRWPAWKLPARRWAVASRWGTEDNNREATIAAQCEDGRPLDRSDYRALARVLFDCDLEAVFRGLQHEDAMGALPQDGEPLRRLPGDRRLRVAGLDLPPGFAAVASPFGFRPLRALDDLASARSLFDAAAGSKLAIASLSSRYARRVRQISDAPNEDMIALTDTTVAGLTVAWLQADDEIVFAD